jgi:hypothetical protein
MQLPPEYLWIEDKNFNDNYNNDIKNSKNVISRQNLLSQNHENIINNNNNYLDLNLNKLNLKLNSNSKKSINNENNNIINIKQYKNFTKLEKKCVNKYFYYHKYLLNSSTLDIFENQFNFLNKSLLIMEKKIENFNLLNELNDDVYQQKILAKYRAQNESYINIENNNKNNFPTSMGKNISQIENKDFYNDSLNDTYTLNKELLINRRSIHDNSKDNIYDLLRNHSIENNGEIKKLTLNDNKINRNNNNIYKKRPISKFSSENISSISQESGSNKKEKLMEPNWLAKVKQKLSGKSLNNVSQSNKIEENTNTNNQNNNNNNIGSNNNSNNRPSFLNPKKKNSTGMILKNYIK